MSDRDVAEIGKDLCDALCHAHERGVIHRDVKPQNAIVKPFGTQGRRAKLMDFGIAAVAGAPGPDGNGRSRGHARLHGARAGGGLQRGPEADVYSLALTLYEAWAGENPVARRTPAQTARQIGQPVPSLSQIRPDLPNPLVAQIDACLEPDPRNRPTLKRLRSSSGGSRRSSTTIAPCLRPAARRRRCHAIVRRHPGPRRRRTALAALAGPAGLPGLALVLAVVLMPALAISAQRRARPASPGSGPDRGRGRDCGRARNRRVRRTQRQGPRRSSGASPSPPI